MPFELQPTLTGKLLWLRPLRADDFHDLYAVASDPLIWEQHPVKDRYRDEVFRWRKSAACVRARDPTPAGGRVTFTKSRGLRERDRGAGVEFAKFGVTSASSVEPRRAEDGERNHRLPP